MGSGWDRLVYVCILALLIWAGLPGVGRAAQCTGSMACCFVCCLSPVWAGLLCCASQHPPSSALFLDAAGLCAHALSHFPSSAPSLSGSAPLSLPFLWTRKPCMWVPQSFANSILYLGGNPACMHSGVAPLSVCCGPRSSCS